jgi:hypothetical protein
MKNPFTFLSMMVILFLVACTPAKRLKLEAENKETIRLWYEEGWNKGDNERLIPRVFHPEWSDGNPIRPESEGLEGMYE